MHVAGNLFHFFKLIKKYYELEKNAQVTQTHWEITMVEMLKKKTTTDSSTHPGENWAFMEPISIQNDLLILWAVDTFTSEQVFKQPGKRMY